MGLLFVPLYIKYLGMEAYGLIGAFAVLQAWLALLDAGMTPALSREMAHFKAGARSAKSIRDLLRSLEVIGGTLALIVAVGIWVLSTWMAADWFVTEKMPVSEVATAIYLMGVVAAFRLIENIYRSSLVGLEQQVSLNAVTSAIATFRGVGSVGVLAWISPTVKAFFFWHVFLSGLSVILFSLIVYRVLPRAVDRVHFSWVSIAAIWRFSAGMTLISLLSLMLMFTDKVLLSRLLSLESFGYYMFAFAVANVLNLLATPMNLAFFPRFTALLSQRDHSALVESFHLGAQLMTVLVGSAALVLVAFGDVFLDVWTRDHVLATNTYPLVAVLVIGSLLNCLMQLPYQMQLAHGWTRLTIKINVVAVVLLVPSVFWVVPQYGAIGAAWIWLVLNAFYLVVAAYFMFRKLLATEYWRWCFIDIALPLGMAAFGLYLLRLILWPGQDIWSQIVCLCIAAVSTLTITSLAAPSIRARLLFNLGRLA